MGKCRYPSDHLNEIIEIRGTGTGDSNGIHYNTKYARMLGFERDFAQPMFVLPKTLE
jgi:hypothetical protein